MVLALGQVVDRFDLVVCATSQTGDLRADERSIRDVVVLQRAGVRFGGELPVPIKELARQVGTSQPFEIHREEPDVEQHVTPTQPVVELQAIEDPGPVVQAEDVVGEQVAVPVDDPSPSDAVGQQSAPAVQIPVSELTDPCEHRAVERTGHECLELPQAPFPQIAKGRRRRDRTDHLAPHRPCVTGGHHPRHAA